MPYDKSVVVPLPADETFALITQPERLRRWNTIAARVDLRAGGDYRWNMIPGHYATGTFKEIEPGKRLVMGWGFEGAPNPSDLSTVTITLEPTADGTIVRLVHAGLPEEQEAGHAQGWDHYLHRLTVAAAEGDAGPDNWQATISNAGELNEIKSAEATLGIVERVLRQIGRDDLTNTSPCEGFTVADLLAHLSNSIRGIGGIAGAEFPAADSGVPEVDIADLAQPALEAWATRGLEGNVDAGAGDMPAGYVLGILSIEFLVHAWDFAASTGQKVAVDDELAAYVLVLCQRVVTEDRRQPGMFGPAIDIADDAPAMDRLLAWTGRQPAA